MAHDVEIAPLEESLSAIQHKALALIADGQAIAETAKQIGVNRGTIYRWMRSDARFRAAYNGWQAEQRESCRAVMLQCGQLAAKKILGMVEYDWSLAWKVVKELGLFKDAGNLTIDPQHVQQEIEIEQLVESNRLEQTKTRELLVSIEGPADARAPLPLPRQLLDSLAREGGQPGLSLAQQQDLLRGRSSHVKNVSH
jgi:AcrR family transcriptional regulator